MPPKRKPPKEGLSQVKLFASSKREPSVKMVRKKIKSPPPSAPQASSSSSSRNNLKAEFQALSQGKKPPSSQPAQVFELSDSEGEAEAGGSRNVMRPIVEQAEGERRNGDGDGDNDDDNVDLVYHNDGDDTTMTSATPAVEQATTAAVESQDGSDGGSGSSTALRTPTNAPRRKNTARCSRGGGRGGKRVMNAISSTSESTMRKISSFKPMMKSQAWPSAADIASSTSNGSSSKQRHISPRASPSLDQTNAVSSQKETDPNQAADSTLVVPQPQQQEDHSEVVANAPSPADTSSEEFHELPEFRRSMSRLTEEAEPPTLSSTNKKRKMITPLESSTDSDLPLANSSYRKHLTPSAPLMDNTTAYISKEEFDKTISGLREEMKQEMNKMKEAMRIETKRLIRAEVKDEILLLTQEQRRQH